MSLVYLLMSTFHESYIKYFSLIILAIQNTAAVLVGKLATSHSEERFLNGTVVMLSESVKLVVCLFCLIYRSKSVSKFLNTIINEIFVKYKNTFKICVPSILYVLQNILLLIALSNLPAAVFQVSYQLKILTTAFMSVLLLKKTLSKRQWFALITLFAGVVMVNLKPDTKSEFHGNYMVGIVSVLLISCTSALSGVYFEKLLKVEKLDLLISNIQLSFTGAIFSSLSNIIMNYEVILEKGLFVGFNYYVCGYIFLVSFGGLIVAVVVKYADNILKGFSTSIAIIISAVIFYFIFSYEITVLFVVGTIFVVFSVIFYSYG